MAAMNPTHTKKILFDFFDGKATAIQRNYLETWLADEANQETYYQYLDEWESERPQFTLDTDTAFASIDQVLQNPAPVAGSLPAEPAGRTYRLSGWRNWAVAASLLLVSLFGGYLLRPYWLYKAYQTTYGETATYRLTDGTRVVLNANSTLRVPRFGFGDKSREVFLTGEAEFNVTHTANHQRFVVRTDSDFGVEVLGTEFVVYARERGKRVFLHKGKVKLSLPQGKQLTMQPGNVVTVANSGQYQLVRAAPAQRYVAWKDHWFYFDNTPLTEVAQQIREQFGVRVIVTDTELAQRRIAGNFKAEKADDLLHVLAQMLDLSVVKTRRHVELRTSKSTLP